MTGFGYACSLILAAVLVRAGAAKLARPATTSATFAALGVPAPDLAARVVPAVELVLAAALMATPRVGGMASLAVLAAFTGVLGRATAQGVTAGCNCFGTARSDPVSWVDLARNGVLALFAVAAATASEPDFPSAGAAAVAVVAAGSALALLRWLRLRRLRPRRATGAG